MKDMSLSKVKLDFCAYSLNSCIALDFSVSVTQTSESFCQILIKIRQTNRTFCQNKSDIIQIFVKTSRWQSIGQCGCCQAKQLLLLHLDLLLHLPRGMHSFSIAALKEGADLVKCVCL